MSRISLNRDQEGRECDHSPQTSERSKQQERELFRLARGDASGSKGCNQGRGNAASLSGRLPRRTPPRTWVLSLAARAAHLGQHQEGRAGAPRAGQRGPGARRWHFSRGDQDHPREGRDRGLPWPGRCSGRRSLKSPGATSPALGDRTMTLGSPPVGRTLSLDHSGLQGESPWPARLISRLPASLGWVALCLLKKNQGHFLKQNEANLSQVRQ